MNSFQKVALAGVAVGTGICAWKLWQHYSNESDNLIARRFLDSQMDRSSCGLGSSKSDYFEDVDKYKLVMTAKEIDAAVQRVADCINSDRFKGKKIVLCGILKGAFIFMTDLVRRLTRPYSVYFVEASSYKGQVQSETVEVLSEIVPEKFAGRHIVLVDELLDNGATMRSMLHHLMQKLNIPREDITTCVLFTKRNESRMLKEPQSDWNADIAGVENLPDVWLVGYGLDDNGTKRGWVHLFAKPKASGVPCGPDDQIFDSEDPQTAAQTLRHMRADIQAKLRAPPLCQKPPVTVQVLP